MRLVKIDRVFFSSWRQNTDLGGDAYNIFKHNYLNDSNSQKHVYNAQLAGGSITGTIVNRVDCLETHQNNNISHYLYWSKFIQKYGSSSSHVYCVFTKSTNRNS